MDLPNNYVFVLPLMPLDRSLNFIADPDANLPYFFPVHLPCIWQLKGRQQKMQTQKHFHWYLPNSSILHALGHLGDHSYIT
jgi:hypothetical protein